MILRLLPVNSYFLAQLSELLNDKPGAVGSPIPEGDHLIRIADDFQIPPQKYILLEITFLLLLHRSYILDSLRLYEKVTTE